MKGGCLSRGCREGNGTRGRGRGEEGRLNVWYGVASCRRRGRLIRAAWCILGGRSSPSVES